MDFRPEELEAAWQRVRENEGCAGVDGITLHLFGQRWRHELERLRKQVSSGAYRPYPLLKILVEKKPGSGKQRRLLVPAVRDRVLQTAAARRLSASFEDEFLESSFAYRPGRSVDRAVARVTQFRDRGFFHVVDADISAFFDEVDHSALLELLAGQGQSGPMLGLVRDWIQGEMWTGERIVKLKKGIAQGSPLSPVLANFFLHDFDLEAEKSGQHLVRYADDWLILCQTREEAEQALARARVWMKERKLQIKEEKTSIRNFKEGFTFLGVYFVDDKVYIPWKEERIKGRLLFMAPPMPPHLLLKYEAPRAESEMEQAMRAARVVAVSGAGKAKGKRGHVAFLYLTEQGAVLRKSGDRFLVEREDRILLDLPYHKLENVLIFGNVQVTTQAMGELLEKGIPVSFYTRQGRFRGSLAPPHGKDVLLRLAQFRAHADAEGCRRMAQAVVRAKLANAEAVLRRYATREGRLKDLEPELRQISEARAGVDQAPGLDAVMGLEGTAARAYFTGLMRFNRSAFEWDGRKKHPAPDPLNALLSFTYTLLMNELGALLEGLGLDPYLGFLHVPDHGRPSLALDMVETFRHPVADRLVLAMVNRGLFGAEDFVRPEEGEGLHLTQDGMRRFFEWYEQWMHGKGAKSGHRRWLKREAEALVRSLKKEQEWKPFEWVDAGDEEEECNTWSVTI